MFIHLVSLTKGAMRMVMVSQLDLTGHMRGLDHDAAQTAGTLHAGQRARLSTSSATISPMWRWASWPRPSGHRDYRQLLDETVEQGYARLIGC